MYLYLVDVRINSRWCGVPRTYSGDCQGSIPARTVPVKSVAKRAKSL